MVRGQRQSVFALAGRSVVSINDYSSQGGAQRLEGVGTGVIWDRYGHGARQQPGGRNLPAAAWLPPLLSHSHSCHHTVPIRVQL